MNFLVYHVNMSLSRKLTIDEGALRAELVVLEERIRLKIRKITYTHKQLPYDRLMKGRELKELCLSAIAYIDAGNWPKLYESVSELEKRGLIIKAWNGTKS